MWAMMRFVSCSSTLRDLGGVAAPMVVVWLLLCGCADQARSGWQTFTTDDGLVGL
jgi:hypothetical protein